MIRISFNGTDKKVITTLQKKGPQIKEALIRAVDLSLLELQQTIQRKLSGEVLNIRSGKGASSVNKSDVSFSGGVISGNVTAGGGPAFYLAIQEKGGDRTYDIYPRNKLALAFFPGGSLGGGGGIAQLSKSTVSDLFHKSGVKAGTLKSGSLKKFSSFGGVVVKHVVHPPLPARPFMKTSVDELRDKIITRIRESVVRAIEAK